MYYPENIVELSEFEKKLKYYRQLIERGKAAEIEIQNIIHERKITTVKPTYQEDKFSIWAAKRLNDKLQNEHLELFTEEGGFELFLDNNKSNNNNNENHQLHTKSRPTTAKSASFLPRLRPSDHKSRPKSAASHNYRIRTPSLYKPTSDKDFSERFAATFEWPAPKTFPTKNSNPHVNIRGETRLRAPQDVVNGAQVEDLVVVTENKETVVVMPTTGAASTTPKSLQKKPPSVRPSTAGGGSPSLSFHAAATTMRMMNRPHSAAKASPKISRNSSKSPKSRRPVTAGGSTAATSDALLASSAQGMSKRRPTFLLHLPDNTFVDAEKIIARNLALRRASLSRQNSLNLEGKFELDSTEMEPEYIHDNSNFYTILLWKYSLKRYELPPVYVSICAKRAADDHLYLFVNESTPPVYNPLLQEKLTIEDAWRLVETASLMPQYVHTSVELNTLGYLLNHMCETADPGNNGYLPRADFYRILMNLDVTIRPEDAESILVEIDPDSTDIIDYTLAIPNVVDMLQAFQAKTKIQTLQEGHINSNASNAAPSLHHAICDETYNRICRISADVFKRADPTFLGSISMQTFRERLKKLTALGMTLSEIDAICASIPKDARGRVLYKLFRDVYYDMRFQAAKSASLTDLTTAGSELQKFVVDLLSREDALYAQDMGRRVSDGRVPLINLVHRLLGCSRLMLSRPQVLILCSAAHCEDGMIDVKAFAPTLADMLEVMLTSQQSKAKSDLFEIVHKDADRGRGRDRSDEEALRDLHLRFLQLFEVADRDHSGELDRREFEQCLVELDIGLQPAEVAVLFAVADIDRSGCISFEEFKAFCSNVLIGMIREKLRLSRRQRLATLALPQDGPLRTPSQELKFTADLNDYRDLLKSIFQSLDRASSRHGLISFEQYQEALISLHIDLPPLLIDVMLTEVDSRDGMFTHSEDILDVQAGLMLAFRAIVTRGSDSFDPSAVIAEAELYTDKLYKPIVAQVSKTILNLVRLDDSKYYQLALSNELRSPFCALSHAAANCIIRHIKTSPKTLLGDLMYIQSLCKKGVMTGIIRNLTFQADIVNVYKSLLNACEREAKSIYGEMYVDEEHAVIPIRCCVRALYNLHLVSFDQADILSILLHSEHLVIHNKINYRQFSKLAAEYYIEVATSEYYKVLIDFNHLNEVDDDTLLQGLSKYHLLDYLRSAFSTCEESISEKSFVNIIQSCPNIKLSYYESYILASFCVLDSKSMISWQEFLPNSYQLLYNLLSQKYVQRRLPLFKLQQQLLYAPITKRFNIPPLLTLAEKLQNIVKIEAVEGQVKLILPNKAVDEKKTKKVHYRRRSTVSAAFTKSIRMPKEISIVGYSGVSTASVVVLIDIYQAGMGERLNIAFRLEEPSIPLVGNVQSLHPRLPSLAWIDEGAAEAFAMNAFTALHIEERKHAPHLVIDGETVGPHSR